MNIGSLKRFLQNAPGKRVKEKIVVIESDDWGSIRMPSRNTFDNLSEKGFHPNTDPYLRYDAMASETDLLKLFASLKSVTNKKGAHPKITANTIVANPDFDKIRESDFTQYNYELFTETLESYPDHYNSFALWKSGIHESIFFPQYHGREHLNVYQWMKALKEGDETVHEAFNQKMISISSLQLKLKYAYMEGLDFFSEEEQRLKASIIREGHEIFKKIFGYASRTFIANCYIWGDEVERELKNQGIQLIQGISNQYKPRLKPKKHFKRVAHYMGQRNGIGQRYLVRNAFFEPSLDERKDWVDDCLKRIRMAFKWGKPAIIGSHRLNYIGFIDEQNREHNLHLLRTLLKRIVKEWPSVEFKSSDQLYEYYFEIEA